MFFFAVQLFADGIGGTIREMRHYAEYVHDQQYLEIHFEISESPYYSLYYNNTHNSFSLERMWDKCNVRM